MIVLLLDCRIVLLLICSVPGFNYFNLYNYYSLCNRYNIIPESITK